MIEEAGRDRRWSAARIVLAAALLSLHAWLVVRTFGGPGSILDERPILQVDHALHLYHGSLGSRFLRDHGVNWGYDPFFMAGYPKTPFHDPSAGVADLSMRLAGGGYSPRAYKLALAISMFTWPILAGAGLWMLGARPDEMLGGWVVSGVYYWGGFAKILLDSGLFSFLWAAAWGLLLAGSLVCFSRRPGLGSWLLLAFAGAAALFVHPTSAMLALLVTVGPWARESRRRGGRWQLCVLAAAGLAAAANLFWIAPLVRLWPMRQVHFVFMVSDPDGFPFLWAFLAERPLELVLFSLGICGLLYWAISRQFSLLSSLGPGILGTAALTFFGSGFGPTRGLEPLRFQAPLFLWLALAGGALVAAALRGIAGIRRADRAWAPSGLVLIAIAGVFAVRASHSRPTPWSDAFVAERPFPLGLTPEMQALVQWIDDHTDGSARILLEDQLRLREPTVAESLHWTCLLPILTGREFIGGHYQVTPLVHHYASFGDFTLGGMPIERLSAAQIREFLELYNIGWIVCWSPKARLAVERLPNVEPMGTLPRYTSRPTENRYFLYRVRGERSFFAQGSGRVESVGPNRIVLTDLKPREGLVVVRYHWLDGFVSDPPAVLERIRIGNDPVGFIGIRTRKPIERLVIENGYGRDHSPAGSIVGKRARSQEKDGGRGDGGEEEGGGEERRPAAAPGPQDHHSASNPSGRGEQEQSRRERDKEPVGGGNRGVPGEKEPESERPKEEESAGRGPIGPAKHGQDRQAEEDRARGRPRRTQGGRAQRPRQRERLDQKATRDSLSHLPRILPGEIAPRVRRRPQVRLGHSFLVTVREEKARVRAVQRIAINDPIANQEGPGDEEKTRRQRGDRPQAETPRCARE